MRNRHVPFLAVCLSVIVIVIAGCGDDDGNGPTGPGPFNAIKFNIFEPDALNSGYVYHLWAMTSAGSSFSAASAEWTSVATFRALPRGPEMTAEIVTAGGAQVNDNTLTGLDVDWSDVDSIYITIEPANTTPSSPQGPVYLVAKVPDSLEQQTIGGLETPVGVNNVGGSFILVSPTDNVTTNDTSGVWFYRPFDPPVASLVLDTLPTGWQYEGWAWHAGTWLSTGTFTTPDGPDSGNPYSANDNPAPPFPGEDFLNNPGGPWVFVENDSVMITVEPIPDTDPDAPFGFRILGRALPENPATAFFHSLDSTDDIQYIPGGNVVFKRSDDL
ncbi:MAG: hypothetical protein Kow0074_01470 [Candidatus Zixiibacteriota bacterium]